LPGSFFKRLAKSVSFHPSREFDSQRAWHERKLTNCPPASSSKSARHERCE